MKKHTIDIIGKIAQQRKEIMQHAIKPVDPTDIAQVYAMIEQLCDALLEDEV